MKRRIQLTEARLKRIINESVKKVLMEYNTGDEYDGYVLIDEASEEILGNYGPYDKSDAMNDADNMAENGGRYLVVGCVGNEYSLDDVVYDTDKDGLSYKL